MYLVQRGQFKPHDPENKYLFGKNGIIDLDYMGSAEFEFGAIPSSFVRTMISYKNMELYDSGIKTKNGLTLWCFCKQSDKENVVEEISIYLKKPYSLKEGISLWEIINGTKHYRKDNFWWEISTNWFFFVGAIDRTLSFLSAIKNDYQNWWLALSEEERAHKIKQTNDRTY